MKHLLILQGSFGCYLEQYPNLAGLSEVGEIWAPAGAVGEPDVRASVRHRSRHHPLTRTHKNP